MMKIKSKKSQIELLKEENQILEQAARNYLIDFSILTNKNYQPNWHHEDIAQELERIENGEFLKDGEKVYFFVLGFFLCYN